MSAFSIAPDRDARAGSSLRLLTEIVTRVPPIAGRSTQKASTLPRMQIYTFTMHPIASCCAGRRLHSRGH